MTAESFKLNIQSLRASLEREGPEDLGFLSDQDDADDVHAFVGSAIGAGIVESPHGLAVQIYPCAVSESDVAVVTVLSLAYPSFQFVGGSFEIRRVVPHDLRDGGPCVDVTAAIVEATLVEAGRAVAPIRTLEGLARELETAGSGAGR